MSTNINMSVPSGPVVADENTASSLQLPRSLRQRLSKVDLRNPELYPVKRRTNVGSGLLMLYTLVFNARILHNYHMNFNFIGRKLRSHS